MPAAARATATSPRLHEIGALVPARLQRSISARIEILLRKNPSLRAVERFPSASGQEVLEVHAVEVGRQRLVEPRPFLRHRHRGLGGIDHPLRAHALKRLHARDHRRDVVEPPDLDVRKHDHVPIGADACRHGPHDLPQIGRVDVVVHRDRHLRLLIWACQCRHERDLGLPLHARTYLEDQRHQA